MNFSITFLVTYILFLIWCSTRKRTFLFFLLPLFYLLFQTIRTVIAGIPLYWSDITVIALLLSTGRWIRSWFSLKYLNIRNWHLWLIACQCLGVFVAIVRFNLLSEPIYEAFRYSLCYLCFPIGARVFASNEFEKYRRSLGMGIAVSIVVISLLALYQFGDPIRNAQIANFFYSDFYQSLTGSDLTNQARIYRPSGPFQAPTTLAGTSLLAASSTWLCLRKSNPLISKISILAGILASVLTLSRHGILAIFLALPFYIVSNYKSKKSFNIFSTWFRLTVVVFLLFFIASYFFDNTEIGQQLMVRLNKGGVSEDTNLQARLILGPSRLFNLIAQDFSVLIFGLGTGISKARFTSGSDTLRHIGFVSNGFLLPLLYTGLFGFFTMIFFWIFNLRTALKTYKFLSPICISIPLISILIILSDNYGYLAKPTVMLWSLVSGILSGYYTQFLWVKNNTQRLK